MIRYLILSLFLLISTVSAKETKINYAQDLSIIGYWASLGIIEGHKWRLAGMPENELVFRESYHFYRAINNACVIAIPFTVDYKNVNVKEIVIANLIGWILYERLESYVERNDWAYQKPTFKIAGIGIPRPSPLLETMIATQLGLTFYHTF